MSFGVASNVIGDGKRAKCSGSFCMDNAFRNAFPVEVSLFFHQVKILHEDRPAFTCSQGILVICNRNSASGCQCFVFVLSSVIVGNLIALS